MISLDEMSKLTTLYCQPHRHYHNINHINDCLVELENIPKELFLSDVYSIWEREFLMVEDAIWFHDAVYNPYSKNNEINSASLAAMQTPNRSHYDQNYYQIVKTAILTTANHTVTQDFSNLSCNLDTRVKYQIKNKTHVKIAKYLLDIDLAGFGQPWLICVKHADDIRKEYYNTNDFDFYTGRLKFLETIDQRDSLYYTDFFKDKYHKQSKENLKIEIERTKSILRDCDYIGK